ncbi:hydrolase [Enterobacter sp. WCHEn045836]|uniref:NlpC/P60 family protein n=1 Tax=Enterobacter sp. WCHEn045836 TaxID=2497434 RepID=UPI000F84174B|nr:NlpC/P60 family protein [Enterobacter sp. WCHEn045836]RTP97298.1 hydrolase [Enterobacter sp. WCHEn045836]
MMLLKTIFVVSFFTIYSTLAFSSSHGLDNFNQGDINAKIMILKNYSKWEGVRYQFGGTDEKGIDCSALIQKIYRSFDIYLPRTTKEQIKIGKTINKHQLKFGDLVFFKTTKTSRHVGIYIGNQEFIHASTTLGVTISSLENSFWSKRYEKSTRII